MILAPKARRVVYYKASVLWKLQRNEVQPSLTFEKHFNVSFLSIQLAILAFFL